MLYSGEQSHVRVTKFWNTLDGIADWLEPEHGQYSITFTRADNETLQLPPHATTLLDGQAATWELRKHDAVKMYVCLSSENNIVWLFKLGAGLRGVTHVAAVMQDNDGDNVLLRKTVDTMLNI